jgi:hypothetical protein
MATISIGPGATNRAGGVGFGTYTDIDKNNPSNGSGTLQAVAMYLTSNATGIKIGTFYQHATSNTYYYCRDSAVIAPQTAGAKRIVTTDSGGNALAIKVCMGDYLGMYITAGAIKRDTTGYSSVWYVAGDKCSSGALDSYIEIAGNAFSIEASGATPVVGGGGWTQFKTMMGTNIAVISKAPGIAMGDIESVWGINV